MRTTNLLLVAALTVLLGGCDLIGGVFKAGMWVGVIGIVAVIAVIGYVVSRFRR